MPAILEATANRLPVFSLWSKAQGRWSHLDTSHNEAELRLKAESLRRVFVHTSFIVVPGTMMPGN
jgi:hypothetical protein